MEKNKSIYVLIAMLLLVIAAPFFMFTLEGGKSIEKIGGGLLLIAILALFYYGIIKFKDRFFAIFFKSIALALIISFFSYETINIFMPNGLLDLYFQISIVSLVLIIQLAILWVTINVNSDKSNLSEIQKKEPIYIFFISSIMCFALFFGVRILAFFTLFRMME